MKKIAILAVAFVLSASFCMADTTKKKTKKKQSEAATVSDCCVVPPLVLTNPDDSLSYAAGKAATQGLLPYLQQQMKVDTAYMPQILAFKITVISGSGNAGCFA